MAQPGDKTAPLIVRGLPSKNVGRSGFSRPANTPGGPVVLTDWESGDGEDRTITIITSVSLPTGSWIGQASSQLTMRNKSGSQVIALPVPGITRVSCSSAQVTGLFGPVPATPNATVDPRLASSIPATHGTLRAMICEGGGVVMPSLPLANFVAVGSSEPRAGFRQLWDTPNQNACVLLRKLAVLNTNAASVGLFLWDGDSGQLPNAGGFSSWSAYFDVPVGQLLLDWGDTDALPFTRGIWVGLVASPVSGSFAASAGDGVFVQAWGVPLQPG